MFNVMFNTNFASHSFFVVILQPMSVCVAQLLKDNFFSLTMDGSTVDSVTEQETIFYLLEPVFR
jgi:hypothetical protein